MSLFTPVCLHPNSSKMALKRGKDQKQSHCDNTQNDKNDFDLKVFVRKKSDESEGRVSRPHLSFFINFACLAFRLLTSPHCSSHCSYLDGRLKVVGNEGTLCYPK